MIALDLSTSGKGAMDIAYGNAEVTLYIVKAVKSMISR